MTDKNPEYSDLGVLRKVKRIADIAQAFHRNHAMALGDVEKIAKEIVADMEAAPTPQQIGVGERQQFRYAMLSLKRIAEGVPMPGKYAETAIKHIMGPLASDSYLAAPLAEAEAENQKLRTALHNLALEAAKQIDVPLEECIAGPIGEARKLLES